jgi:hypothetical protein
MQISLPSVFVLMFAKKCVRVCVCVCVFVCVCAREKESSREKMCLSMRVCVLKREREILCVWEIVYDTENVCGRQ